MKISQCALFLSVSAACSQTPPPDEPTAIGPSTEATEDPESSPPGSVPPAPPKRKANVVLHVGDAVDTDQSETILLESMTAEEIAPNPVDPTNHPGGSGLTLVVKVDGDELTFSDLPEAYSPKKVDWTDKLRLELVSHDRRNQTASFYVDRVTDASHDRRHTVVAKGESVELNDGWFMDFEGHGHYRTRPGQRSPLRVHIKYRRGSQSISDTHHLYPPDGDKTWSWRDYTFEITGHQYDRSMDLTVGRMVLEPARLDTTK